MCHKRKPLLFVKLYILEAFAIYLFRNFTRNFYHWNRVYLLFTLYVWKFVKLVLLCSKSFRFTNSTDFVSFIVCLSHGQSRKWKIEILILKFNRNRCKLIRFLFHGVVQFLSHFFNFIWNYKILLFFFFFNPFQRSCNALFTNCSIQRK